MSEPIHILSLGAGVQSSTMALMAAHGEITPMPKCAIFADTQAEPASVYKWLDWLEGQLPYPIHRVSHGNLTTAVTTLRTSKHGSKYLASNIPAYTKREDNSSAGGIMNRQCTNDYKVVVIDREVKRLCGVKRGQTTVAVVQLIGISLDEVHRMKSPRNPWQEFRYPLIDLRMRRHDCLLWMQSHGYPKPPRSACVYCPYHSDGEWRRLREEEPDAFAEAVRVDKKFRELKQIASASRDLTKYPNPFELPYLHNSRVPLDEVDFSTDEDHGQQVMFGNECEGMCGV